MLEIKTVSETDTNVSFNQRGLDCIILGLHQQLLDTPSNVIAFTKEHLIVHRDFHSGFYRAGDRFNCSSDKAFIIKQAYKIGSELLKKIEEQEPVLQA